MGRLSGKHVVLTGVSSGIGRAAVPRFAAEGARLALLGQDERRLAEAVKAVPVDAPRERTVSALARLQVATAGLAMPLVDAGGRVLGRWLESGREPAA